MDDNNHNNNSRDDKQIRDGSRVRNNRILPVLLVLLVVACLAVILWWPSSSRSPEQSPLTPERERPYQDTTAIITQRVETVQGVEGANVIVLSRTALIALEVKTELTSAEVKRIKKEASIQAKDLEGVDEVLVTANPGLIQEIKAILNGEEPLEKLESIYEKIRDQKL